MAMQQPEGCVCVCVCVWVCVCVVCLGGTAGYRGRVLIGLMVARVNRAVIG